ncbi:MAG: T9SS type A sorting domain-containing protein, partial [Muribaculaceae bacterium]|nr:T9SS type A sorting domain-containing protein [Muribaculaceae bacterium]
TYTEGKNDMCAPAVQMLAFSDKSGRLTDRFAAGSEIVVEVAAGDANGNGRSVSYMDAKEVKVEYAPHGSDNFVNVPLKYVKGATSSSIWSVYGGSISNPSGSSNGWYDVRISVVDNENNRSVQTVSPAFKVYDASTGVDEILDGDGVSVSCDGATLSISGVENPSVEIYALGGYRVLSATGNTIDLSAVAAGIYFVRLGDETYKIAVGY